MKNLENYVKGIPDFPKPGVLFRDVTGILESPDGFQLALDRTVGILATVEFDLVAVPESRGFIFGAALADRFRTAFFRSASRASSRARRFRKHTTSNTGRRPCTCTRTPSSPARRS